MSKDIVNGCDLAPVLSGLRPLAAEPRPENGKALCRLALQPGHPPKLFIMYVAQLPFNKTARWDEDQALYEIQFPTDKEKWLPQFEANVGSHYTWMMHVMFPRGGLNFVDPTMDRKISKAQRPAMSGTGMVNRTKIPHAKEGDIAESVEVLSTLSPLLGRAPGPDSAPLSD